jgi:hypothetical protein
MKKYIYISALSLSLVGMMSSCDLDAPSKSTLDSQTVFSTYDLAEQAVMGIHQSFGETNSYRGRFLPYYGLNTDIEHINGDDGTKGDDKYLLCRYDAQVNSSQMNTDNNAYAKFFEAVERANQGVAGLRAYGNVNSNSDMAQLLGELLTLRAVVYLDLLNQSPQRPCTCHVPIATKSTNSFLPIFSKRRTTVHGLTRAQ